MRIYVYMYTRMCVWTYAHVRIFIRICAYKTRLRSYSGYQSYAPSNDSFPISKTKFWWTSVKCFYDNSRVHFVSVSQPCSIVIGSGIIAQLLWQLKVICNFAEMESYVKKTWSVFESHSRNNFSERNICEEGGVSIVQKQN